jgi:hypothetical protein
MSAETRSLTAVVAKIIESKRDESRINPDAVASAALLELDPKKISVPAVLAGCHLALRQIARGQLRKRFLEEPDDDEDASESEQSEHDCDAPEPEQADLFPQLQRRYPSSRAGGIHFARADVRRRLELQCGQVAQGGRNQVEACRCTGGVVGNPQGRMTPGVAPSCYAMVGSAAGPGGPAEST